ncbi:MAG: hypothetical protein EZS28_051943, partial [Streblomastix strix]
MNKALSRNVDSNIKKVGIISGYQMKEIDSSGNPTSSKSTLLIESGGKFSLSEGRLSFINTILQINNIESGDYIITGSSVSSYISISNCCMTMTSGLTINKGFIKLNNGSLSIVESEINDIHISGQSVIKVNEGSVDVIISKSSFSKIQQSGTGNGAAINADMKSESKLIIKDGSSFSECQSVGSGGAIYAILNSVSNGGIFIEGTSKTSFSSCISSDKGGCIYIDVGIGSEDKF